MVAPDGPFKIELKVCFVNETGQVAEVAIDLAPGEIPTGENISLAIVTALQVPALRDNGFSLMTRHQFVEELLFERAGARGFAVPGPDRFNLAVANRTEEVG